MFSAKVFHEFQPIGGLVIIIKSSPCLFGFKITHDPYVVNGVKVQKNQAKSW